MKTKQQREAAADKAAANVAYLSKAETVEDFRLRIAAIMRSIDHIPDRRKHRPCVRTPADSGYYPPPRRKS